MNTMKIHLYVMATWFGLLSCQQSDTQRQAQRIIDRAIEAHGGEALQQVHISFDFRKYHYEVQLDQGKFIYERTGEDSVGFVHDVLTNQHFTRSVDNQPRNLSEKEQDTYRNSLNSVVYFVLLPYPLNDPAANKEYLGETMLQGEPYHKIKVTFDQEGGGDDFNDEFIYWIHRKRYTMDYLAYEFHVNDGGTRFREAYNVRKIQGIRFADYINYESTQKVPLEEYDRLFEEGKVKELSRIETKNVEVQQEDVRISAF